MSKKDKKKAIREWEAEKLRRDKERQEHEKHEFVPDDDLEEFDKTLVYAKTNCQGLPAAPNGAAPGQGARCSQQERRRQACGDSTDKYSEDAFAVLLLVLC